MQVSLNFKAVLKHNHFSFLVECRLTVAVCLHDPRNAGVTGSEVADHVDRNTIATDVIPMENDGYTEVSGQGNGAGGKDMHISTEDER